MTEIDVRRIIKEELSKALNIILSGSAGNATNQAEDIQALFPGMSGIVARPVMHPYGFCSLAPDGTISVVAKQGDHPGNRLTLGHRAADRPSDLGSGESVIYNEQGQRIYLRDGEIQIGSQNSKSPVVLGDVLMNFMTDLINDFLQAQQIGFTPFGPCFLDPGIRQNLTQQLQKYVTEASTNVASQLVFTERGGS